MLGLHALYFLCGLIPNVFQIKLYIGVLTGSAPEIHLRFSREASPEDDSTGFSFGHHQKLSWEKGLLTNGK